MSETLAGLRGKIGAAEKLAAVVRSMKAIAASSIGQYQDAVHSLENYEQAVNLGLSICFRSGGALAAPPPVRPAGHLIGAIIFGSDQGLVGRFNADVADLAMGFLDALPGQKRLWVVGERVYAHLQDAGMSPAQSFAVPASVAGITDLVDQLQIQCEPCLSQDEHAVLYVFHIRAESAQRYAPHCQRLLPLDAQWHEHLKKLPWPSANLPECLGRSDVTLRGLVREYLFITLYKACAESLMSENGSRLAAMQRAENNIEALSADLTQSFYRLRQSSIDEELFDVIAGSSAQSRPPRVPRYSIS